MADEQKIENRKIKRREASDKLIQALMPKSRSYMHKKRHKNESLEDFRARRKASNRRRREREGHYRTT